MAETIRKNREELDFVPACDAAMSTPREVVEVPNQRASLFVCLCLQNGCHLAKAKRNLFKEITANELAALQNAIQAVMATRQVDDQTPE